MIISRALCISLCLVPTVGHAAPAFSWESMGNGFHITANEIENRNWSCTAAYTIVFDDYQEPHQDAFNVNANATGDAVLTRVVPISPYKKNSRWSITPGEVSCF